MSVDRVTRAELATLLGRAERTVSRLEEAGVVKPVRPPRRGQVTRFALGPTLPARSLPTRRPSGPRWRRPRPVRAGMPRRRGRRKRRPRSPSSGQRGNAASCCQPEQVVRAERNIVAATKTQLLAVARRAVLAGLPRTHEPLVKRFITEALRELADIRTVAGLRAATRRRTS